ncbi:MAG: FHA domain-containing protein [Pseudomonadota bacterium]
MTESTGEPGLEFPIDQQLLEEATRCREEWRVIKDRLGKIDSSHGQVTQVVYERVRKDYEARLKDEVALLLKKKSSVDQEIATLKETRNKINSQLEGHRHALEEIQFRNTLGEFDEEKYQSAAREEQDKIAKFETVLSAVDTNISRYEAIFASDEELFAAHEPHAEEDEISGKEEISSVTSPDHEAEPMTDDKGFVIEEEGGPDYFSASTDAGKELPGAETSTTSKIPPDLNAPRPADKKRARVVVINGDDAGAAYTVKGTVSFGRAESNTVVLRDAKASRQHAQIQQQGSEYVVVDLNSSNGTYVNGQRIEEHVLSNGDEIQIGDAIMQFQG